MVNAVLCWTLDLPAGFDSLDHSTPQHDLDCLARLVKICNAKEVIEIGSWAGLSTLHLAQPGVRVNCIDHWKWDTNEINAAGEATKPKDEIIDRAYQTFCRNMGRRLNKTVFPYRSSSDEAYKTWDRVVDLVFIDGAHDYESVVKDLRWRKFVRPGGILCGHDYGTFQGVNKAIDRYAAPVQVEGYVWWKRVQ